MNVFNHFISDATIDRITEAGREIDQNQWLLGDEFLAVYKTLRQTKRKIVGSPGIYPTKIENNILAQTEMDCRQFVADHAGRSTESIKRYAQLAEFYPPNLRRGYQILPLNHFRWIMGFPEHVEQLLNVDMKLVDTNGGKPVPLRILQALFRDTDKIAETLNQLNQMQKMDDVLALAEPYKSTQQIEEEEKVPPLVYHFLKNLNKISQYIERAIDLWTIPTDNKREIVTLVKQLNAKVRQAKTEQVDTREKVG